MYAEGDSIHAGDAEAELIIQTLKVIVQRLKQDDYLHMPLISFIFAKEISKFYATKHITKGVDE